jgi:hypothetical protein
MIPSNYLGYFQAASQASGALIGLLFVVVALRPDRIIGPRAASDVRRLAASSFTGLVNAFFVSLLALIPGENVGIGGTIMAVVSLYHTLRLHLGVHGGRRSVMFFASLLAYGIQLYLAVEFVLRPHDSGLVGDITFVLIASFAVALGRAWQLMQSAAEATGDEATNTGRSGDGTKPG